MADLTGFDATEIEPSGTFEPIPGGNYTACITESELKDTKANNGQYLHLKFQIIEGPHENRVLFGNVTLENPSKDAVRIGKEQLSAICHAVGVLKPADSSELHDKPLTIRVVVKDRSDIGLPSNEIKGYGKKQVGGVAAALAAGGGAKNVPAWKRGNK